MVDLKAKPFNLADEDIRWVEETIGSMTLEEKVGQLFIGNATPGSDQINRDLVEKHPDRRPVAISMHLPNHLIDIPMVKTYINTYAPTRDAFRIALDKIMGKSGFTGVYSENVFCDAWDTRL